VWIRENKAVNELIRKLRDDERRHTQTLMKLTDKTFYRMDPGDMSYIMRGQEFADERYRRSKEYRERNEEERAE
jgi:hypothetical protein